MIDAQYIKTLLKTEACERLIRELREENNPKLAELLNSPEMEISNSPIISYLIARNVHLDYIKEFVALGCDINLEDSYFKMTPLAYLTENNNRVMFAETYDNKNKNIGDDFFEIAEFLLEQGADVNHRFADNKIHVLHNLMFHSRDLIKKIELFMRYGADINVVDDVKTTPAMLFLSIAKHKIDDGDAKQVKVLKYFIENGLDLTHRSCTKQNILWNAINSSGINDEFKMRTEFIEILLKHRPELLNEPDVNGATPLMYSCEVHNEKMFMFLLECGADITQTNNKGETVIDYVGENKRISDENRQRFLEVVKKQYNAQKNIEKTAGIDMVFSI